MTSGLPSGFEPYDRPLRVGILGLGRVYDLTITGYRDNDDAEIVALCDRDRPGSRTAAPSGPTRPARRPRRRSSREDMDLVEVLVPTPMHARSCARSWRPAST